jgi:hypothetical protein
MCHPSMMRVLPVIAAIILVLSGLSFFDALRGNQHAREDLVRAEIRQCRQDAAVSNRQRTLDLALIAAARAHEAVFREALTRAPPGWVRVLITEVLSDDQAQIQARTADELPYISPASCLTAVRP